MHRSRSLVVIHAAMSMMLAGVGMQTSRAEVEVLLGLPTGRPAGEPDPARVNEPFAVAFDSSGCMYGVEFTRGNRLFRVRPTGPTATVEFVAGRFHVSSDPDTFAPDTATAAADVRFHGLHDVAIGTDGLVYLADTFNHRIRAFDPRTATVSVVAGTGEPGFSGDGGPAAQAAFKHAYCGSLAPDDTAILVGDIGNARLRRIDLVSRTVSTIAGTGVAGRPVEGAAAVATPLAGPRAACMTSDGTIYLALREGNALVEIRHGTVRIVVNASGKAGYGGDGGPGRDALLAGPKYVSLDHHGRVLIADTENHCIRRYDPESGRIDLVAGAPGEPGTAIGADLLDTHLTRPHGCTMAPDGRLVIVDSENDRILAGRVLEWSSLPALPDRLGLAGVFAGTSGGDPGALVVAGGANFPDRPLWEGGTKAWHARAFVLPAPDAAWIDAGTLPRPLAYGVSASHAGRVWCVGGCDSREHVRSSLALRWNAAVHKLDVESDALPPLPMPLAYAAGTTIGSRLYVAGGQTSPDSREAVRGMWSIDLADEPSRRRWQQHPPWPGPARTHAVCGVRKGRLLLVSGVELVAPEGDRPEPGRRFLTDAYEFDPASDRWRPLAPPPAPLPAAAGPAVPLDGPDGSRLLFLPGNDWNLFVKAQELADRHPGFPRQLWIYDADADAWHDGGRLPQPYRPVVTTPVVAWGDAAVIPTGEARPCVRSPQVFQLRLGRH